MSRFNDAKLRTLLATQGHDADWLAAQINQPKRETARLAAGEIKPSISTYAAIVRALGCNAHELLSSGEDDRGTELGPEIDEWIASNVANMPPMTDEQAQRTSYLLFGSQR